jgi:prepilin-type N-terminal cleavage/methylation domain-containing protein
MNLSKKMKKGFTLVELIVVIAIIAILAAVSVAGYFGFINQAKVSTANQEATQVKTILVAQTVADGYSVKLNYVTGDGNTTIGWVVTYTQNSGLVVSKGKGTSEVTSALLSAPVASQILAEIYTAGNSEKTIATENIDLGFEAITSPTTKAAVVATVTNTTTIESFQYYTKDAIKANSLYLK